MEYCHMIAELSGNKEFLANFSHIQHSLIPRPPLFILQAIKSGWEQGYNSTHHTQ